MFDSCLQNYSDLKIKMADELQQKYTSQDGCRHSLEMGSGEVMFQNLTLTLAFLAKCCYEYVPMVLLSVILVVIIYLLYKAYLSPVVYVKDLSDVGFDHLPKGKERARLIARAQRARQVGNKIPPPYPNGWFAVCERDDVKIGGVKAVDVLGQNLCVYRGEDGIARCVDAYCPHLGANLAIGGTVCGPEIECPFHKWRFAANGNCVAVPGNESPPKGVSIKTWTTKETDNAIWIWYDAEGRAPTWDLPDDEDPKEYAYRGRNEFTVSCHIQEIPENGADVAHLNAVHSPSVISNLGEKYPFLENIIGCHIWSAQWNTGPEEHTATMKLIHDYRIFKKDLLHLEAHVTQIGPGLVRLRLNSIAGPVLISQSVTPVAPLQQKIVNRVFTPTYNAVAGVLSVFGEGLMLERDIAIWNSKRFVSAPAYVKLDKTIRAYRTWFSKFYSENSVSFKDANNNPYDW